jgi:hypothetical protein
MTSPLFAGLLAGALSILASSASPLRAAETSPLAESGGAVTARTRITPMKRGASGAWRRKRANLPAWVDGQGLWGFLARPLR